VNATSYKIVLVTMRCQLAQILAEYVAPTRSGVR
jgi:hypothetical protein